MFPSNSQSNIREKPCQYCNRRIIESNHQLHESRCGLMSSRVRNQVYSQSQKKQRPSQIHNFSQRKSQIIRPQQRQEMSNRNRARIFNNVPMQQQSVIELIPCSNCGQMLTFAQLDTHPTICAHQQAQCQYCHNKIPSILMEQHEQQCPNRQPVPQPVFRMNRRLPQFNHQQQIQQQDQYPRPFNLFAFGRRNEPRNEPRIVQRSITNVNGRTRIQEIDQHGNVRITQTNNDRNNRGGRMIFNEGFGHIQREGLFRNNHNHSFADFFRLLQQMAGSGGSYNQGLTRQQIRNLNRLKYKKPVGIIQQNQKDLCTICYCDFQQEENVVKLRCNHLYHEECIVKWLQNNAKCPVCKAPQTNRQIFNQDD